MKFQTKLMISMMGLVVLVTWVVMSASRGKVVAAYTGLYEERYEGQVATFLETQATRIDMLEGICGKIAEAGDLPAMLEQLNNPRGGTRPDLEPMRQRFRSLFELFGRTESAGSAGSERSQRLARTERRQGGRRSNLPPAPVPLVCLMTKDGTLVPIIGLREGIDSRRLNTIREAAGSKVLDGEGVRYLAVDLPEGERGLREVVVAPMVAAGGGEPVGALVVGADPRQALGSRMARGRRGVRGEAITTGIVLGGEFYGETEAWQDAVGQGEEKSLIALVESEGRTADEGAIEHRGKEGRMRVHFQRLTGGGQGADPFHLALYSLAPLDGELAGLRGGALAAGGLGLALAVVLSYLLSRALAVPVRELSKGTAAVADGQFDTRVPVRGGELGQLAASFNAMAEGLAMKEKYRSVLGKVADEAVAEALVAGELELGGEEIEVSILFCDIRGFTAMSDGRAPSEVIALLNEHMTAMTEVVYEHFGVVDKFVGDEIMAVFGAPKTYGADAANACRCALEMVARRARANTGTEVPIEIGIGVATGRVVAGCMGSESRLNYTVVGDRVNLAARLCGVARAGEVVVDSATWAQLEGVTGDGSVVELKGIAGPVPIWRLRQDQRPASPVAAG